MHRVPPLISLDVLLSRKLLSVIDVEAHDAHCRMTNSWVKLALFITQDTNVQLRGEFEWGNNTIYSPFASP